MFSSVAFSAALLVLPLFASAQPAERAVHLSLTPVPRAEGLPPHILWQQHHNRALSRHARMRGVTLEEGELEGRLRARIVSLGEDGVKMTFSDQQLASLKRSDNRAGRFDRRQRGSQHIKNKNKTTTAASSDVAASAAGTVSASNSTTSSNVTTPASTGSTSTGFSDIAFAALQAGKVTASSPPDTANSLAYDIEAADVGYLATVQIGTPPKDFVLLMDTGSSDTWVPSQACTQCGLPTHNALGSKTSSSFVASTSPFTITYGSGAAAGMVASDTLTIANMTLPAHALGVTLQESAQFSAATVPFDGLMGLALSSLSTQKVLTPPAALLKAGNDGRMSFDLGRVADGTNTGQITFAGVDQSRVDAATLVKLPNVSKSGFWEAAMDDATLDGKALGLTGRNLILDTGTTLMIVPQADAVAIHSQIPGAADLGQGSFSIPCSFNQALAFSFGGQSFAIDPRDMTFQPLTADLAGECLSSIGAGDIGAANEWLVGDAFLKNVFLQLSLSDSTVSLSKKVAVA